MSDINHLVIITGATKGIGLATAEAFAKQGFDIIANARSADDLAQTKKEIEQKYVVQVHTLAGDLAKAEECKRLGEFAISLGQPIAALINNAGVFLPGAIHDEPEGNLEKQIETNLYSAYHVSRAIIPQMQKQKHGHIFNVCSIASTTAYANGGSYAISKHAMYGFSKCLREEMKPFGVRVTSVMPGATLTNSWAGTDLPDERFMPAQDIATMIMASFNLSPRTVAEDIVLRPQLGDI